MHLCRDSSVIAAREQALVNEGQKVKKANKKRGRPLKNAQKTSKEPSNLEKQLNMEPDDIIKTLKQICAWTYKTNSQGNM